MSQEERPGAHDHRKRKNVYQLRKEAEELLRMQPEQFNETDPQKVRQILQELQVHRIELELQNEELQNTQKELDAARTRYARLYQHAPVGYVVLDAQGIVREANATFCTMTGHTVDELRELPFAGLFVKEDENIFRARYKAFFRKPAGKRFELRMKKKGHSSFYAMLEAAHNTPDREAESEVPGNEELLVTVNDITKRKKAEQELAESREYLATTLNSIGDAVITTDTNGMVTGMNPVAETLTGWSSEEAFGQPATTVFSIVNSRTGERAADPIARVLEKGTIVGLANHTKLLSRDGSEYHVADSAAPIRKEDETLLGVVCVFRDVTRHYHDEQLLRESRLRLQRAQRLAHLGSWELDLRTQELIWSDETYRIIGMQPGQQTLTYDTFLSRVHPEDRERVDSAYRESVRLNKDSYEVEHRIVRPHTKEVRHVHEKCFHVRDDSGQIIRSQGMIHDVTEWHEAEARKKMIERRFKEIYDGSRDGYVFVDIRGNITHCNQALCDMLGYSEQELRDMGHFDAITPRKWHEWERTHIWENRLMTGGYSGVYEKEYIRKDGTVFPVELESHAVHDRNGKLKYLWGLVRDVTERRRAHERLMAEKERLAVTLRSIGDGVITTDMQGRVVLVNRVAEELTGWSQMNASGRPLGEVFTIINEFSRKPCDNPVDKVLTTGSVVELANHTLLVDREGNERVIADSGAPIRDARSEVIGVVLVFRDVTEKQRLLEHMQRSDRLDSLGVLAGGIAHDFNNLLSGVFGYMEMARELTSGNDAATEYLDKALRVHNRARDLTQQLLTFAKGGSPVRKSGNIAALVKEAASFALSGSSISCTFDIDEELRACEFDENQMGQVIDNLVLNAQQAMPLGGTVTIEVANADIGEGADPQLPAGPYVTIRITDTGTGIPPTMLDRIFDPFFTTKNKGSGLGLATCYSIVQKHDGTIRVASTVNEGTTFTVWLPASASTVQDTVSTHATAHTGTGVFLVMDDEEFVRDVADTMLTSMGYEVETFDKGEDVLDYMQKRRENKTPVTGILLDLTVPGAMGGKETITLLRNEGYDLPVFASSGYSEDPVIAHPRDYGFTDSIRKPYRKRELAALLQRHL